MPDARTQAGDQVEILRTPVAAAVSAAKKHQFCQPSCARYRAKFAGDTPATTVILACCSAPMWMLRGGSDAHCNRSLIFSLITSESGSRSRRRCRTRPNGWMGSRRSRCRCCCSGARGWGCRRRRRCCCRWCRCSCRCRCRCRCWRG
jgi:hypothetical protein